MYLKKAHIHFVGIGGIGMSGIAKILKYQGYKISGCDLDLKQKSIEDLIKIGCNISYGHNTHICQDQTIDIVVYSSAVKPSNPEIITAQKRGIPIIPRALMLAELMRTKYSIAISGAHGKTTTTSMISHILIEAKLDPTVIIGGHLKNISANAQFGTGDFLVAEADESDRSLLHLNSTFAVVTNIDLEHLETYKDLDDIKNTFIQFINNLPFYGKAFLCVDDENIRSILPIPHVKIVKYGIEQEADVYAKNIELNTTNSTYDLWKNNKYLGKININMPGKHNVLNSLAAIALCLDLEISFDVIAQALKNFKGIERRFSFNGHFNGAEVFDDYGHHPNEIINTLAVARKYTTKKLHVVFQPHRYTRTEKLWYNFIQAFLDNPVDNLIITDIYAASEQPIANITSQILVKEIKKISPNYPVTYLPISENFEQIIDKINLDVQQNDLLLLLGAGKINNIASKIILK